MKDEEFNEIDEAIALAFKGLAFFVIIFTIIITCIAYL